METRKIGSLDVTVVGIGCNNFGGRVDEARTAEVVLGALDAGVNFFDTADIYGQTKSEQFIGKALGSRRDEAVIATKFGGALDETHKGARPDYVKRAAEDSLGRLGIDCIDLYQLHRPDPETPISDTLGAMNDLIAEGKVREIGCSNFSAEQLAAAQAALAPGAQGFITLQNEYSLLNRAAEESVLPACEAGGIGFLPYFPLFNGLLTGKYRRGEDAPAGTRMAAATEQRRDAIFSERNFAIVEALTAFAEERGHTLLELAFGRLLAEPVITSVIAGATSAEQVAENAAAAAWVLTPEEVAEVDRLAPA